MQALRELCREEGIIPAIVCTSLSPRPERFTTIIWSSVIVFAFLNAYANAWALSIAGMIPSSRQSSLNACIASSSVTEDQIMVVNLSGRGDKDVHTIAEYFKDK